MSVVLSDWVKDARLKMKDKLMEFAWLCLFLTDNWTEITTVLLLAPSPDSMSDSLMDAAWDYPTEIVLG